MIARQKVEPQQVYMVGDSAIDIEVAKNAGTNSVAVTYGFGDAEELQEAKADIYVDNLLLQFHKKTCCSQLRKAYL